MGDPSPSQETVTALLSALPAQRAGGGHPTPFGGLNFDRCLRPSGQKRIFLRKKKMLKLMLRKLLQAAKASKLKERFAGWGRQGALSRPGN